MKKVCTRIAHVSCSDIDEFFKEISEHIDTMQINKAEVEVQYQIAPVKNKIIFTALILGYEVEENN